MPNLLLPGMKINYFFALCFAAVTSHAQRICATYDYVNRQPVARSLNTSVLQSSSGSIRDTLPGEIITVPVVIHILYNNSVQNISDVQVYSQLDALNKDYRRLNNIQNIPAAFASISADVKIIFCLAKTDPAGKTTTGIIRKYTQAAAWQADDKMKFSAALGDDAWDSKRYLNIWVCNLFGRNLGYSSLPGGPSDKDGIVIQYDAFGTAGTVSAPFNNGRTATHEIGHWLGLKHLWGDDLCGDDLIDDTPPQKSYNNGCPSFPHVTSCSKNADGDMFMNFMDFTDDECMSMFTIGQKNKMRGMFAVGEPRNSLLNSSACNEAVPSAGPLETDTVNHSTLISLYPNPAKDFINIKSENGSSLIGKTLTIYDVLGKELKTLKLTSQKQVISVSNFSPGIYLVKIGEGRAGKIMRFIKQ